MKNRKVFIGNLNFSATEDELREFLMQYGTVTDIRLYRKKGYAFAEFETAEEAERAVDNLAGVVFMEREVHISMAVSPRRAKAATIRRFNIKGEQFASRKKTAGAVHRKKNFSDNTESSSYSVDNNGYRTSEAPDSGKKFSGRKGETGISHAKPGFNSSGVKKKFSREEKPEWKRRERPYDSDLKRNDSSNRDRVSGSSEDRPKIREEKSYRKSSTPGFNYKSSGKVQNRDNRNDRKDSSERNRSYGSSASAKFPAKRDDASFRSSKKEAGSDSEMSSGTYKPRTGKSSFGRKRIINR